MREEEPQDRAAQEDVGGPEGEGRRCSGLEGRRAALPARGGEAGGNGELEETGRQFSSACAEVDRTHRCIVVKLDLRAVFHDVLDGRPRRKDGMEDRKEKAALVDLPGVSSARARQGEQPHKSEDLEATNPW